jgi:hypothetical protein
MVTCDEFDDRVRSELCRFDLGGQFIASSKDD